MVFKRPAKPTELAERFGRQLPVPPRDGIHLLNRGFSVFLKLEIRHLNQKLRKELTVFLAAALTRFFVLRLRFSNSLLIL